MHRHISAMVVISTLLTLAPAYAESQSPFRLSPTLDWSLGITGTGLLGFDLLYTKVLKTDGGIQSYTVRDKDDAWAFDRWAVCKYSKAMDVTSTIGMYATSALPLIFLAAPREDWVPIYTMYAETIFLSQGVKEFSKAFIDRDRPYMYHGGAPEKDLESGDYHNSFFSGHTTTSFAAATFTSYVFCKEFPDSKWKLPVVATSYALATATSALRITGGSHFTSDVLVGAAFGTLTGWLVPYLHTLNSPHGKGERQAMQEENSFQLAASPLGVYACITL